MSEKTRWLAPVLLASAVLAGAREGAGWQLPPELIEAELAKSPEKTWPPEKAWKAAPPANLARQVRRECQAAQIHGNGVEWLRITCSGRIAWLNATVTIAAGSSEDVAIDLSDNWMRVTFPLRPGDRRVVLFDEARIGISALWLSGDAKPNVVID